MSLLCHWILDYDEPAYWAIASNAERAWELVCQGQLAHYHNAAYGMPASPPVRTGKGQWSSLLWLSADVEECAGSSAWDGVWCRCGDGRWGFAKPAGVL